MMHATVVSIHDGEADSIGSTVCLMEYPLETGHGRNRDVELTWIEVGTDRNEGGMRVMTIPASPGEVQQTMTVSVMKGLGGLIIVR
jgi:hypothetical protein